MLRNVVRLFVACSLLLVISQQTGTLTFSPSFSLGWLFWRQAKPNRGNSDRSRRRDFISLRQRVLNFISYSRHDFKLSRHL